MKPLRSSFNSFFATTVEYQESEPIEPARLDLLVTRLRAGDESVSGEIIKGHYRLVAGIVAGRVRSKKFAEDALAAALLALTEAVSDAAKTLYDNNITYYITSAVQYAIKDAMADNHVIRVPNRTVRHKIAKGEAFEDIVPGDPIGIQEDESDESEDSVRGKAGTFVMPYAIPVAKRIVPSAEFQEALAKAAANPMEVAIIRMRSEGYGYREIAEATGYHTSRIGQIVPQIEERFDKLYS